MHIFLLKMMMQRRHREDSPSRQLEGGDLHDHRHRLQHEEAADDGENQFVFRDDACRAERAAQRRTRQDDVGQEAVSDMEFSLVGLAPRRLPSRKRAPKWRAAPLGS